MTSHHNRDEPDLRPLAALLALLNPNTITNDEVAIARRAITNATTNQDRATIASLTTTNQPPARQATILALKAATNPTFNLNDLQQLATTLNQLASQFDSDQPTPYDDHTQHER